MVVESKFVGRGVTIRGDRGNVLSNIVHNNILFSVQYYCNVTGLCIFRPLFR